jgi:hypothetical protein
MAQGKPDKADRRPDHDDDQEKKDREWFGGRTEQAEGRADEHGGEDMRRRPHQRGQNIGDVEAPHRHPEHASDQGNEGAHARRETDDEDALVAVRAKNSSLRAISSGCRLSG